MVYGKSTRLLLLFLIIITFIIITDYRHHQVLFVLLSLSLLLLSSLKQSYGIVFQLNQVTAEQEGRAQDELTLTQLQSLLLEQFGTQPLLFMEIVLVSCEWHSHLSALYIPACKLRYISNGIDSHVYIVLRLLCTISCGTTISWRARWPTYRFSRNFSSCSGPAEICHADSFRVKKYPCGLVSSSRQKNMDKPAGKSRKNPYIGLSCIISHSQAWQIGTYRSTIQ